MIENEDNRCIIFARVSTARQEKEGLSIDEIQLPRARQYAKEHGLIVVKEYAIGETGGSYKERKKFYEMMRELKKPNGPKHLIAFRIDRITRCFRDAVEVDNLRTQNNLKIHLVDEHLVLHKDSPASDLTAWNVKVFIAQEYVNRAKEDGINTKYNKLERGELPWCAPYGYHFVSVADRKAKIVTLKEPEATIVKELHERYSAGTYSCQSLAKELNGEYGTKFSKSRVHSILTDKFYIGFMIDKKTGKEYPHIYEHLLSDELFYTNQDILNGHSSKRRRYDGVPAIYRGLIDCPICGCSVTPDFKKKKQKNGNVHEYAYYHCTDGKKEHTCAVKTIREEQITEAIAQFLSMLVIPENKLTKLKQELRSTHDAKNAFYESERKKLINKRKQLSNRKAKTYDAWMDQYITKDDYEDHMARYAEELKEIAAQEERLDNADTNFYVTVKYLLAIFENAPKLFKQATMEEKRQIIGLLFSNLYFDGEKLTCYLKKPFDELVDSPKGSLWLGRQDSNLRMSGPKPGALPLGDGPMCYPYYSTYFPKLYKIISLYSHRLLCQQNLSPPLRTLPLASCYYNPVQALTTPHHVLQVPFLASLSTHNLPHPSPLPTVPKSALTATWASLEADQKSRPDLLPLHL